jgi:hypothetical protein
MNAPEILMLSETPFRTPHRGHHFAFRREYGRQ